MKRFVPMFLCAVTFVLAAAFAENAAEKTAVSGLDPRLWQTSMPSSPELRWSEQRAPGDGGTCWYLRIHPQDPNRVIESKDMGGTYITTDGSRTYQSVNDPDWTFPRMHYVNGVDFCRSEPSVGYAVTSENGAFKTTDKGLSWTPLDTRALAQGPFQGRFRHSLPFSTVAVHPDDPAEVWVGTGLPLNDNTRRGRRMPCGVGRSTDGGATWTLIADAIPSGAMLRKMVIAPKAWNVGSTLLAATDRGFFVSRDGGGTWTEKSGAAGHALPHRELVDLDAVLDPVSGKVVIAATLTAQPQRSGDGLEFRGGVWRSADLGETWEDATGNLRLPAALVLAEPDAKPEAWSTPINGIADKLLWDAYLTEPKNRALYDAVVGDPLRHMDEYMAGFRALQARESQAVREEVAARLAKSPSILHDFHTVRIDPRNARVFYASIFQPSFPYGVWKTVDGGQTWVCTVRGAQGWTNPDWAAYRPPTGPVLNVEQVWSQKHPMNWGTDSVRFGLWDVRIFDLCAVNPDVLYFHTHRVTYRSDDGAATWRDISNHLVPDSDGGFVGSGNSNMCVYDVAFHPTAPGRILFAMADCGVKTSADGGRSLKSMPGASFGSNQWVFTAAFDPDDPDRFWQVFGCWDWLVGGIAGTYFLESRDFGRTCVGVTVKDDGSLILPPTMKDFKKGLVNTLLVDPRSPGDQRRFVAAHSLADRLSVTDGTSLGGAGLRANGSEGIKISEDGGKTWTASNSGLNPENLNVVHMVADPRNFDVLYAAVFLRIKDEKPVSGGLYRSSDSGRSWSRLDGLPLSNGSSVVVLADGTLFVSGGYGTTSGKTWDDNGGVYRSKDGGATWQQLLAAPCVPCVAVNPADPNRIYCTVDAGGDPRLRNYSVKGSGVWRSTDAGATWRRVNRGLATPFRFTFLRFNPHVPGELWLGTFGSGWYRTVDTGN
jgi:photosystem II stability/assembly factor-like uncharacterized protein